MYVLVVRGIIIINIYITEESIYYSRINTQKLCQTLRSDESTNQLQRTLRLRGRNHVPSTTHCRKRQSLVVLFYKSRDLILYIPSGPNWSICQFVTLTKITNPSSSSVRRYTVIHGTAVNQNVQIRTQQRVLVPVFECWCSNSKIREKIEHHVQIQNRFRIGVTTTRTWLPGVRIRHV